MIKLNKISDQRSVQPFYTFKSVRKFQFDYSCFGCLYNELDWKILTNLPFFRIHNFIQESQVTCSFRNIIYIAHSSASRRNRFIFGKFSFCRHFLRFALHWSIAIFIFGSKSDRKIKESFSFLHFCSFCICVAMNHLHFMIFLNSVDLYFLFDSFEKYIHCL